LHGQARFVAPLPAEKLQSRNTRDDLQIRHCTHRIVTVAQSPPNETE
jgi:hypothetical protein